MKVTIIGAGNAGWHIGCGLYDVGHRVIQVLGKGSVRAQQLARATEAEQALTIEAVTPDAEVYLLAVPDAAIAEVARSLSSRIPAESVVVHCSGASSASLLKPWFRRHGVFWPPQTLSVKKSHNWQGAPVCVSGSDDSVVALLSALAESLGAAVHVMNEDQRQLLHVAAVFANNFTNYCLSVGYELCGDAGMDFSILHPIIRQTLEGAMGASPASLQTGPAARGDEGTMRQHLAWLKNHHPEWVQVYRVVSKAIREGSQQTK